MKQARFNYLLKVKHLIADKAKLIQETAQPTMGNPSPTLQLELKRLISIIPH